MSQTPQSQESNTVMSVLTAFPVSVDIAIAWGEMDAFQHVNNIVYFRYFETARIAYFRKIGYTRLMKETGVGPILADTRCRYRIPLTFPDTVRVGARISEVGEDRFLMNYRVFSLNHQKVAADGEGLVVSFDYRQQCKTPLPSLVKDRIHSLESTPPNRISNCPRRGKPDR
jgi:acyl-CoA thioester hydrolase